MLQGRVGQAVKVRAEIFVYRGRSRTWCCNLRRYIGLGVVSRQGHRDVIDLRVMFGSAGTPELEADLRPLQATDTPAVRQLGASGSGRGIARRRPWLVDHRHG